MIDLHCHILPKLDDGAKSLEDSIVMAKEACKEGIHTIVATPHHQNGVYINQAEDILHQVKQLNDRLKEEDINLTILPGQEIRLYGELLEDYELGRIVTMNRTDKYIFIEFPANHVPRYAEKCYTNCAREESRRLLYIQSEIQELLNILRCCINS